MHKDIGKLTLLLPFLVLLLFPLVVQGTMEGRNSLSEDFNAVRVCDNPRVGGDSDNLNFSGGRNEIETGLYYFGIKPNPQERYVEFIDSTGELALRKSAEGPPRTWLVTGVGASLYQISTCVDERPLCLAVSDKRTLSLETCATLRYGTQVWWSIGITIGPGAGGIVMGNDGFGRMDCLEAGESGRLELPTCANSGHTEVTWFFEPARQTSSSPQSPHHPLPKQIDSAASAAVGDQYQCESGESLVARYDETHDQMIVTYKGKQLPLHPVMSASGAKFGGTDVPWGWWSKGNSGFVFFYDADGAEQDAMDLCKSVSKKKSSFMNPVVASDSTLPSGDDGDHDYMSDNNQVRNEQAPDNLAQWYTSQYQNQFKGDVVTLTYGIPETDATAFQAECAKSSMVVAIVVTDTGSLTSGTQTSIKMTSSSASKTYRGTVADGTTSYPGIRLMLKKGDTLWTDLAKGSALTLESAFGTTLKLGAESGSAAVADFVRLCRA